MTFILKNSVAFLLVASAIVLFGCGTEPMKPVNRSLPLETIEFRPVIEDGGVEMTMEGTGELLRLGDTALDLSTIERIGMENNGYGEVLNLEFTKEGAGKLATFTGDHLNKRIAVVLQGKLVMAPNVMEPIAGGFVQVSGSFTKAELEAIVDALTAQQ